MRKCRIPSMTLGSCDLPWGHDGEMHASHGDGFYSRESLDAHRTRQDPKFRAPVSRRGRGEVK